METYSDILREIASGSVEFAVMDDVLVRPRLDRELHVYGGVLDKHLQKLYERELGRNREFYAVAIRDRDLLETVNKILETEETARFIEELREKWIGAQ